MRRKEGRKTRRRRRRREWHYKVMRSLEVRATTTMAATPLIIPITPITPHHPHHHHHHHTTLASTRGIEEVNEKPPQGRYRANRLTFLISLILVLVLPQISRR